MKRRASGIMVAGCPGYYNVLWPVEVVKPLVEEAKRDTGHTMLELPCFFQDVDGESVGEKNVYVDGQMVVMIWPVELDIE